MKQEIRSTPALAAIICLLAGCAEQPIFRSPNEPATAQYQYRYNIGYRPGGYTPERHIQIRRRVQHRHRIQTRHRIQDQRRVTNTGRAELIFPIPSGARLSSPYGYRRDPFSNRLAWHGGIDLAANLGAAVVSAHSGWCSRRYSDQSGWVIRVSSPHFISEYRHLSATLRDSGLVRAGETIGVVGATGQHCTGPHLHFTLSVDGAPVDPVKLLAQDWRQS